MCFASELEQSCLGAGVVGKQEANVCGQSAIPRDSRNRYVGRSLRSELLLKIEFDMGFAHEEDEILLPLGQSHCGLLYL